MLSADSLLFFDGRGNNIFDESVVVWHVAKATFICRNNWDYHRHGVRPLSEPVLFRQGPEEKYTGAPNHLDQRGGVFL